MSLRDFLSIRLSPAPLAAGFLFFSGLLPAESPPGRSPAPAAGAEEAGRLEELSRRLETAERALAGFSAEAQRRARLDQDGEALRSRLDLQESKSAALERQLQSLSASLAGLQDSLGAAFKELSAAREDFKARSARLDSLNEWMGVLKKDQDAASEELVELRQALKRLEPGPGAAAGGSAWFEQVSSWKYLPALATGLALLALGMAAAHR